MDFTLTKELQMLRKMYRDFAENEIKPLAAEIDEEERFAERKYSQAGSIWLLRDSLPQKVRRPGQVRILPMLWQLKNLQSAAPRLLRLWLPTRPCAATPSTPTVQRSRR